MNDKFKNGLQWERLCLWMVGLWKPLESATEGIAEWRPEISAEIEVWDEAWAAWREVERPHIEIIHESARELVRTSEVLNPSPEVLYFLRLRLRASIDHLGMLYAHEGERVVSLVPFPPITPPDYAEWLMTKWADEHAIQCDFPGVAAL